MAATELGDWCMAKCNINHDEAELVIMSPASTDDIAVSISVVGLTAILALRDLIDEEVARAEQRASMAIDHPDMDDGL